MKVTVPLPRVCRVGMRGRDVYAYQRLLRHRGHRISVDGHFGPETERHVSLFQVHQRIARGGGVVGERTYDALWTAGYPRRGVCFATDAYGRWLLRQSYVAHHHRPSVPSDPGAVAAAHAMWLYARRPFAYRQVRPYPETLERCAQVGSDCSGTSTLCYKGTGLSDPNGFAFNGYGYTGTLIGRGSRVATPELGDLCFYYPSYDHVGVYVGNGWVFSHGQPGDPRLIPASWATMIRRYT